MKRTLSLFLSLIMSISVFASCDTDTENSGDASAESKNEEISQNVSESVSDNSTDESGSEIPKNVKYYDGDYDMKITESLPISVSGITTDGKPVIDENSPSDLYCYVGFHDELSEDDISFLEKSGVIFAKAEGNVFVKGNESFPINDDMTEEEKLGAMRKNCEATFENVDMSQYTDDEIKYLYDCFAVSAVGYVNISAHRAVANAKKTYSVSLRPSEDDRERYLKLIDSYRKNQSQK